MTRGEFATAISNLALLSSANNIRNRHPEMARTFEYKMQIWSGAKMRNVWDDTTGRSYQEPDWDPNEDPRPNDVLLAYSLVNLVLAVAPAHVRRGHRRRMHVAAMNLKELADAWQAAKALMGSAVQHKMSCDSRFEYDAACDCGEGLLDG